jgi:hypothetical protein
VLSFFLLVYWGASMKDTDPELRYRDKDGQIAAQHGDTLISSLRQIYGLEFARDIPGHFKINEVLHALDDHSLNCLISEHHRLAC